MDGIALMPSSLPFPDGYEGSAVISSLPFPRIVRGVSS
jgi:hypothetical protein